MIIFGAFSTASLAAMNFLCLPAAIFASVAAALLSRVVGGLWLRAALVVVVAYATAFTSLTLLPHTDDQFSSWAPLLLHMSFGAGAVIGIVVLVVSNWLLKPRGSRGS
jgi:hypothetical protein